MGYLLVAGALIVFAALMSCWCSETCFGCFVFELLGVLWIWCLCFCLYVCGGLGFVGWLCYFSRFSCFVLVICDYD